MLFSRLVIEASLGYFCVQDIDSFYLEIFGIFCILIKGYRIFRNFGEHYLGILENLILGYGILVPRGIYFMIWDIAYLPLNRTLI